MMPLSKAWLLLMGALSALVSGAIGLMIVASGGSPILVTPMLALLQGLLAVFLLWAGVHVKRFIAHKSTWVNSMHAMRIALGARASAIVASLLVGALLGILVATLSRIGAPEMRDAEPLHKLLGTRLRLSRLAVKRARQQHVLLHRQAGERHDRRRRGALVHR